MSNHLSPLGNYLPALSSFYVKDVQSKREQWKQEELDYQAASLPFVHVISRQEMDKDLPPSVIPGKVWFDSPKFFFGDVVMDVSEECILSGIIVGINWDEKEWTYNLLCELGVPFPAKEKDLIKYEPKNVMSLTVYKHNEQWVFDDMATELIKEPFVAGIDTMIDRLTVLIDDANDGFTLKFSTHPFPDYRCHLEYLSPEGNGAWYYCPDFDMKGWLCPALSMYFDEPPTKIYVQAVPLL